MGRDAYAQWQKETIARPEKANEGQRFSITRSYVAKMTEIEPTPDESEADFKERFAQFQTLQISYIAKVSEGSFATSLTSVYRNAHLHAELVTLANNLHASGAAQTIVITKADEQGTLTQREFDLARYANFKNLNDRTPEGVTPMDVIAAYEQQQRDTTMIQLSALKQMNGSQDATVHLQDGLIQNALLLETRHDLALCEKRMQDADFSGLGWTGSEESTRNAARYVMNVELRKLLREEADRLRALPEATTQEFVASVMKIKALLQGDPVQFEQLASRYQNRGADGLARELALETQKLREQTGNEAAVATTNLFSDYRWIRQRLYLHPPAAQPLRNAA
jgi:hypothetical protein